MILHIVLLTAATFADLPRPIAIRAQHGLAAPISGTMPRNAFHPPKAPVKPPRFDLGPLMWLHAGAATYDGVTTQRIVDGCRNGYELNPVSRVFIGRCAQPWRMGVFGTAEVLVVAAIPNKKWRRIAQIGLIATHVILASRNLR